MTNARTLRIRLVAATLGVAALLVPVTISPGSDGPVDTTDACAGTACCFELGSECRKDGQTMVNAYEADACVDQADE